jgi:5-formyltetrahydrofolate cyclo-ligase
VVTEGSGTTKSELRMRFQNANLRYLQSTPHDQAPVGKILTFLSAIMPKTGVVSAFMPLADEPNLTPFFKNTELEMALPRIEGNELKFYVPNSVDSLSQNKFGIYEPDPAQSKAVEISSLMAMLIPAVAFDRKCMRLGRGKGFYDRALMNYKGLKIGIATIAQISNEDLPAEQHDQSMDIVITDQFILRRFDS